MPSPISPSGSGPILTLRNISKSFGGTRALTDAQLDLHPGQVTALIGENGAGKSTLVKILTGIYEPDGGVIRLDGSAVRIDSPAGAQRLGISAIHQESVVFDDVSVAENIFVTARPRRYGLIDWGEMRRRAASILAQLEANIGPTTLMRDLSVAQKHLVQIARALSHDSRIVIMDEPTAALSHHEAQDLLRIVRRLREDGRAVLFISHKFEEIFAIADRYAVYRDGIVVGAGMIDDSCVDHLITLMVGRSVEQVFPLAQRRSAREVLRLEGLSRNAEFADVNLTVRQGEIVGVYGLVGAGRSEVMQTLFGLTTPDAGRVLLDGSEVRIGAAEEAIRLKIAYVPEDRQTAGCDPSSDHPGQHRTGESAVAVTIRLHECIARAAYRTRVDRAVADPDVGSNAVPGGALRRKSTEGRAGQVAADGAEDPDPG